MIRTLVSASLLLGLALQGSATFAKDKDTLIDLSVADGRCQVRIGDQTLPTGDEFDTKLLKLLPNKKRPVRFTSASYEKAPYRCFGSMIFNLQRLGYQSIIWAAEPPPLDPKISILDERAQ